MFDDMSPQGLVHDLVEGNKEHGYKEENEPCCSVLLAGPAVIVVRRLFERHFVGVAPIRFKAAPDGTGGIAVIHRGAVSRKGLNSELPIFLHAQSATVAFLELKQGLTQAIGAVANGVHGDFGVPLFNVTIVNAIKVFVIVGGGIDKV